MAEILYSEVVVVDEPEPCLPVDPCLVAPKEDCVCPVEKLKKTCCEEEVCSHTMEQLEILRHAPHECLPPPPQPQLAQPVQPEVTQ